MKWKIYSTPDFVKLMTSPTVYGNDDYASKEDDMFVFVEWIQKRLNSTYYKKLTQGAMLDFVIDDKEDLDGIASFCRFYIRSVKDPLSGVCEYEKKINKQLSRKEAKYTPSENGSYKIYIDPEPREDKELFKFTTRTKTDKDKEEGVQAIALKIVSLHTKTKRSKPDDTNRVRVMIFASTISIEQNKTKDK